MKNGIGVFICQCSENISGKIDIEALRKAVEDLDEVAYVAVHPLLCAPDGKKFMTETLLERGNPRTVVAACSPKEHEPTFQRVMAATGNNQYLLQMANIREHAAWVTDQADKALEKSLALTKAAIRRVRFHEQLTQKEIEVDPDVLVVGGGVAGMEAALLAARAGRKVTLVEKSPSVGGSPTQYEEVAPNMECAPCMMAPLIENVSSHENITVLTSARVTRILGFLGNFEARIERIARLVNIDLCLGCDECIQACPVSVVSAYQHGLGERKAIYVPFPGASPNAAVIDRDSCLRFKGETCTACADACPLKAVDFSQQDETLDIKAGAAVIATGFSTFDPRNDKRWGMSDANDVYTLPQLERLTSNHGPTGGRIVMKNGVVPKRIAVVHCVGRDELGYCSGVCCQSALKTATLLKGCSGDKQGASEVLHLITDLVAPGRRGEGLIKKSKYNGAKLRRTTGPKDIRVEKKDNGLAVHFKNISGLEGTEHVDMVVLATGILPSEGTKEMVRMLDLVSDEAGFIAPDHPMLRPSDASLEGVFVAGCAAGPGDIPMAVATAKAAVGTALARVQPGKKMPVETLIAETAEAICSKCLVCVSVCPFHATYFDEESDRVAVNEVLCRGCGTCVASCASGATRARQFTDDQLNAEIREVLNV